MNFVKVAFFSPASSRAARHEIGSCLVNSSARAFNLTRGSRCFGRCRVDVPRTVLAYASMMAEGDSICLP